MAEVCCAIVELIPWVVNETAALGEKRAVHEHVLCCDACRRELACVAIVSRRAKQAMAALEGLTEAESARLSATASAPDADEPLLSKLARMLDAFGMPGIVGDLLRSGATCGGRGLVLVLNVPLVAPVEVQL